MPVWDTSVASGLHPESQLFDLATQMALNGESVQLVAATVAEISFGLKRKCQDPRFADALAWFTEILRAGAVEVLPLSREGALLTGQLRAAYPVPPSASRGDKRSNPERRIAWINDIQIAASAWLLAEPICTKDQDHFRFLADALAKQFPGEGELELMPAPI